MKLLAGMIVLFAIVVQAQTPSAPQGTSKEGYHDLELPDFHGVEGASTRPGSKFSVGCTTHEGQVLQKIDPGYDACLAGVKARDPLQKGSGKDSSSVNLNFNTGH